MSASILASFDFDQRRGSHARMTSTTALMVLDAFMASIVEWPAGAATRENVVSSHGTAAQMSGKQVRQQRCVRQWRTSGAEVQWAEAILLRADHVVPARGSLGNSGASDSITREAASILASDMFAERSCVL